MLSPITCTGKPAEGVRLSLKGDMYLLLTSRIGWKRGHPRRTDEDAENHDCRQEADDSWKTAHHLRQ
ncbi:unnamed protein product [Protopolystoma xenopodis]|uniref:Uncharacterized protein n=1 Tax=Protopolystoma xenopodis TaxID=117903 RepID=A0A448WN75_9PLAT|nr:unnamed protein product [Protopolystoma xenopodis]